MKQDIVGYSGEIRARPGERIEFKVSSYGPRSYRADIVRILCGDDTPGGPGFQEEEIASEVSGEYPGRRQEVYPGSYVWIPADAAFAGLPSFTTLAVIWPTAPGSRSQVILGNWSETTRSGFALLLDEQGALALRRGGAGGKIEEITTGSPLKPRRWYFVAARVDATRREVRLYQEDMGRVVGDVFPAKAVRVRKKTRLTTLAYNRGPFLIAAWQRGEREGRPVSGGHFNGKIESPRLASRALRRQEMEVLLKDPLSADLWGTLVGAWDFSRDISSEHVTDRSPNHLHGETVHLPTRGVTGHLWDGAEHDWKHRPDHYGAIHFHDDDLYDAGWSTDFAWDVPHGTRSGLYAARLQSGESEEYIPFFVVPPRGKAVAKVAFLASTATYMAYANSRLHFEAPGVEMMRGRLSLLTPGGVFLLEHPEYGLSLYDHHNDGSGVCYSSRLRPILDMRPKTRLWSLNADTHITAWLERAGVEYDVLTDEDLHAEPDLLKSYRVVLTGAHPEYFSLAMLNGIEAFTRHGGRLMYLGGNGFYWRISYHPEKRGVIEVRRNEDGTRAWRAEPGEYYHSFTGEYGGLWRRQRRAPNRLVGVGFSAQGFDVSTYYLRRPGSFDGRVGFIFDGLGAEERIGDFGLNGDGAAGEEIDRLDRRLGSPDHALVLASSENHSACYMVTKEDLYSNVPGTSGRESPMVRADMVFFECPGGGAVFSTGSIAWSSSLCHNAYDNNVARITGNVLRRFAEEKPFEMPDEIPP